MAFLYWGFILLFGIIHAHALTITFLPNFPLLATIILIFVIVFILAKTISIYINQLSPVTNGIFICLQLFNAFIPWIIDVGYFVFIPFLIFIGIEVIRLLVSLQIRSYTKTINQMEASQNQFNEMFRVVRGERHDFLKHVSAIHYLLENEQTNEAKSYMGDLVEAYEETNLSIKGERGVTAGILYHNYQKAKENEIEIIYDFELPISSLPLTDQEIVTLIGNLLSNSIDASLAWQIERKKQARIRFEFYKRSGLFILICKNNSLPIPTKILDQLYKSYGHTTKGEGHEGLGTKLIMDIVKKYHGYLDFVYKNETFTVQIKIPAIV